MVSVNALGLPELLLRTTGEIDLAPALQGPIFQPLRDPLVFRQFQIHPEFHTLVWPHGADIAPEFLHDNVRVTA